MRCGALDAESCATGHCCPAFGGHREPGWRADCPLCQAERALFWKVQNGRVRFRSFCADHDEDMVLPALAERLPECVSVRSRRGRPDAAELEALALDKTITPNALRMAILRELGWGTRRIAGELKLPRRTYYDAVRILAQRPRSR